MSIYWFFLSYISLLSLFKIKNINKDNFLSWYIFLSALILFIGFRHEIGGDWFNYLRTFEKIKDDFFLESILKGDPAYNFISYLIYHFGLSIHWLNLIIAFISVIGLSYFAKRQSYPWLALLIAFPFFIIVVFMGYTRQAAALGLSMIAYVHLIEGKRNNFIFLIILATLFHKTAIILLPLGALVLSRNKIISILMITILISILIPLLILDRFGTMWSSYVESGNIQSDGGLVRVLMNTLPALIFITFIRKNIKNYNELRFWNIISLISIIIVPLTFFASTVIDRLALYLIPLQLYVFTKIPLLFKQQNLVIIAIITYYGLAMFVWLNFGSHAHAWIPYNNYLLEIFR